MPRSSCEWLTEGKVRGQAVGPAFRTTMTELPDRLDKPRDLIEVIKRSIE